MERWSRILGVITAQVLLVTGLVTLAGCMAQQADIKQTERQLQRKNDELAQRTAKHRQELEELRGQEIPRIQGELDRALHQLQELQGKQEDLRQRSAVLEQQMKKFEQLIKLEQRSGADTAHEFREAPVFVKTLESRLDSHDELLSSLMVQLSELTKQVKALEKR